MTLADLIAQRRTAIAEFERNLYGQGEQDISSLNEAIERAPMTSKADALAALDLVIAETTQVGHPPAITLMNALRRFIDDEGGCREVAEENVPAHDDESSQE